MKRFAAFVVAALLFAAPSWAQTAVPQAIITPTTTAYVSGNCLGNAGASAILTVPGFTNPGGAGGTLLVDVSVTDNSGQDASIDLLFFSAPPTGTYTDHAACSLATSDTPFLIARVPVTGYVAYGTPGVATVLNIPIALNDLPGKSPSSGNMWVVPVVQGTPTYGTTKLYLNFGVISDGLH